MPAEALKTITLNLTPKEVEELSRDARVHIPYTTCLTYWHKVAAALGIEEPAPEAKGK
jgi:hypothetical protein